MEQGIFYIVIGLASVCFFLLGKYVFPQAADVINSALTMLESYPLLMKWGEAECRSIKQYMDNMTGEEKKARLDAQENSMNMLLRANFALLGHALNGNNVEQMQSAFNDIQEYLFNR